MNRTVIVVDATDPMFASSFLSVAGEREKWDGGGVGGATRPSSP